MKSPKRVLLLGAGGMGMAPLALYLQGAGIQVEAYDDRFSEPLRSRLLGEGIEILGEPIPTDEPDCVIRSSAVSVDGAQVSPWTKKGIPVYQRGEFLAKFTAHRKILAVVGSHGKTTTTGMLVWALEQVDFPCSYLVGGCFRDESLPPGKFIGKTWIILEVDESDGTIEKFSPTTTLALNCDWDHVDRYDSSDSLASTFQGLFGRTKECLIVPQGTELEEWARSHSSQKLLPFEPLADPAGYFESNKRAALAAGKSMGIDLSGVDFSKFPGMKRRQSVLHDTQNRSIVEDYAHHPTEIRAFLSQRRLQLPDHLLQVVFQPHRFSRTQALAEQLAEELSQADDLHLMPTYGAFEKFNQAGSAETLMGYLPPRLRDRTRIFSEFSELRKAIGPMPTGQDRDQVLFVGAGDLERWAHAFASWEQANGDKHNAFAHYLSTRLSGLTPMVSDEPLASKTTIRVGGTSRWYAEPAHSEDLRSIVEACTLFGIQRAMIGRGSNLIIPDEGFGGLVLRLRGPFWKEISRRTDNTLVVGAGARLKEICKFACVNELKGFEFLEGIPGTLGGALRMNAGAMGWETFDLVEWVSFLLPDGSIRQIPGSDLDIGYRYCKEAYEGIALRAKLRSEGRSDHRAIRNAIDKLARKRRKTQPKESSSGCIFRNPDDVSAGLLIDQVGLKGEREGGAVVSDLHANFIVNDGGATAEEVIALIKRVRDRVKESNGHLLEPEVTIMGKSWNEYLS
jgi:UDP-N-acetylenolpyruvoylglucosamine reductase